MIHNRGSFLFVLVGMIRISYLIMLPNQIDLVTILKCHNPTGVQNRVKNVIIPLVSRTVSKLQFIG
jgi:hypothetical protein